MERGRFYPCMSMYTMPAKQPSVILPWFGNAIFAVSSLIILKTCPHHFHLLLFRMMQYFLMFCCFVEFGVGNGLMPIFSSIFLMQVLCHGVMHQHSQS